MSRDPYYLVAWLKDPYLFSILQENGVRFELDSKCPGTPLHYAVGRNYLNKQRWISGITEGPRHHRDDKLNQHSDFDPKLAKFFLDNGINVNQPDGSGMTPFQWAIRGKDTQAAQFLLDHGAKVNKKDENSITAFQWAMGLKDIQIGKWLLDHGAYIDASDLDGMTPLHHAVSNGELSIVKWLLEQRANLDAKTKIYGDTPLHIATRLRRIAIVELLLSYTLAFNSPNEQQATSYQQWPPVSALRIMQTPNLMVEGPLYRPPPSIDETPGKVGPWLKHLTKQDFEIYKENHVP